MKKEQEDNYNKTLETMKEGGKDVIEFSINCIYNGEQMATMINFKDKEEVKIPVVDLAILNMLMKSLDGNGEINFKMSTDEKIPEENRNFYKGVAELCSDALTINNYYLEYLKSAMNNPSTTHIKAN